MREKILELDHITKYIFNVSTGRPIRGTDVKILDDVHFDLYKGEVHALLGENGAGKSTLMKIIGGIIPCDEGVMKLDGKEIQFRNSREARAKGIAFVHQELNLCTNIDVAHNFYLANEPTGKFGLMKEKEMYEKSAEAIRALGFELDTHTKLGRLSTAQQQIVEISKALSYDSKIIIMDEPTASLTKKEIEMLFSLIHDLKKRGISIIYISHRLDEIQQIGDRMTVMRDGCYIGTMERAHYSDEQAVNMMAGRVTNNIFEKEHIPGDEIVLEIKDLKIGEAAEPLSLTVKKGEVVGLCGLVGAGRTELARTIYGARPDAGGEVWYQDELYRKRSPGKSIQKGIVYLSEDRKIDGLITAAGVSENLVLSALHQLFPGGLVSRRRQKERVGQLIGEFNIKCMDRDQLVSTLSGGNQQKVSLGKCFAVEPKVLILDEPTRGIDINTKFEIYHLIDQAAKQGLSVLVISSEMAELIGMSDRIYIMRGGTITGMVSDEEEMTQENLVAKIIGV